MFSSELKMFFKKNDIFEVENIFIISPVSSVYLSKSCKIN